MYSAAVFNISASNLAFECRATVALGVAFQGEDQDMLDIRKRKKLKLGALMLVLAVAVAFLYGDRHDRAVYAETSPRQLTSVDTVTVEYVDLRQWRDFSGRLRAVDAAQIRPLVSGAIQKVLFEDGAHVEQGQTLFVIDPRPFEARLQRARAVLSSAESELALAQLEFERADALVGSKAVSKSIRDTRENALHLASSALESAKAQLLESELDLEYAYVKAPIAGRISRAEVTVGNVVQAGANAPVLASVINLDQLYAEFDVDGDTYFNVMDSVRDDERHGEGAAISDIPVEIALGEHLGVTDASLHSFDNRLDERSGTIRARAIVENTQRSMIPGIFVNVRIGTINTFPTLLVPERAIGISQSKRYVYVVNADNIVEYRDVVLGEVLSGQRTIKSGVTSGERIIVNGIQRVMVGMRVDVSSL